MLYVGVKTHLPVSGQLWEPSQGQLLHQVLSCPVPQKMCSSYETLCTSVSFLTAVLPGAGFYFQFSAICQLKAMHILSSAVFQYSGLAQLQNVFLRSFSGTQFQHLLGNALFKVLSPGFCPCGTLAMHQPKDRTVLQVRGPI